MPRVIPRYRKHKSGQAVVSIDGTDIYLGRYDTPDSRARYAKLLEEYLQRKPELDSVVRPRLTVAGAIDRFWFGHAASMEKRERHHFQRALQPLTRLYGDKPLSDFGPLWFRAVRKEFVALGWSRQHANAQAGRLKRFLRWLVSHEMYDVSKLASIREVPHLTTAEAKDNHPIAPISWPVFRQTLRKLPLPVRDLVLFQWWTGARPGEACTLRGEDIDRSGKLVFPWGDVLAIPGVWVYRPVSHKNTWRGRERIILIGPKGQAALGKLSTGPRFDPRTVARNPRAGEQYTPHSLVTAVRRACSKLAISSWHPHQIRHAAATRFRSHSGLEVACTLLGHARKTVTERYAVEDWRRAAACILACG